MANNIKSLKSAFNVKLGQLKLYLKIFAELLPWKLPPRSTGKRNVLNKYTQLEESDVW